MEPLWSPWLQPLNRGTARRVDSRLQRAFGHERLGRRFEEERPNLLEPVARLTVAGLVFEVALPRGRPKSGRERCAPGHLGSWLGLDHPLPAEGSEGARACRVVRAGIN